MERVNVEGTCAMGGSPEPGQEVATPQKPYSPPVLIVYGSLRELTRESPVITPEFDAFFAGTIPAS